MSNVSKERILTQHCGTSWQLPLCDDAWLEVVGESVKLATSGTISEARKNELRIGPVRAVRCLLRGGAALHGAAVSWGGNAVAIIGGTACGKSTLTSACVDAGATLLSDGSVCIDSLGQIVQGPSRIKMRREGLLLKGLSPEAYELVHERSDKHYVRVSANKFRARLRLKQIVVLEVGNEFRVEEIGASEKIKQLLVHSYLVRLFPVAQQSLVFSRVAAIAKQCTVTRLVRSTRFDELGMLVRTVKNICVRGSGGDTRT